MMSDNVLIAIVAAVPGVVASVLSFFNRSKLSEVKENVNGRLTELLRLTREHYYEKGKYETLGEPSAEHPTDHARRIELEERYRFEPPPHKQIHRVK